MSDNTRWFHDLTTDEARQERATLAQRVIAVLGVVCLIVLVGIATNAAAQEVPVHVLEQDGLVVRLMPGPCVEPQGKAFFGMVPEYAPRAKALQSVWRYQDGSNRPHAGCWLELSAKESGAPEAMIILFFDDGERHVVPKSIFTKKNGQSGA